MWTIDEYDPDIPYSKRTHGTCTCCGESDLDLIILNDDDHICMECLEFDYQKCDVCGEYWPTDMVDFIGEKAVCSYCAEEMEDEGYIEDEDDSKDEDEGEVENLNCGNLTMTVFALCNRIDDICQNIKSKISKEGKEYASKNGINVADSLRSILADINHANFWGETIDESMCEEAINKYKSFSSTYGINLQDVIKTLEGMRDRDK